LRYRNVLNEILAKHTGQPLDRIAKTPTAISSLAPKNRRNTAWSMTSCKRCQVREETRIKEPKNRRTEEPK